MIIKELIKEGRDKLIINNISDSSIIARMLLEYTMKVDREYLVTNMEQIIEVEVEKEYQCLLDRVINGTPIQYITNKQEFMKLSFYVDENVLVPQPDTEVLVEEVIEICNRDFKNTNKINILDICTGSGCIGISVAKYMENVFAIESDVSNKALQIAKLNCEKNELKQRMEFIESDLFQNIHGKFDIIVSNPPYIRSKEINLLEKNVRSEPILALDGGEDGLYFYRKIIGEGHKYIKDKGYLCLEIGFDQRKEVIELIERSNLYSKIYSKKDLSGNDRIVIARIR